MPRPTQGSSPFHSPTPTGLSPATAPLSSGFSFARGRLWRPYNPHPAVTGWVWANPLSLAATRGITIVFFSWGYLDVSVLPVRLRIAPDTWPSARWVAPFGYPRIDSCLPIPAAFRSLPRPSSPIGPKASPVRPFLTPFRAPAGVQLRRMRRFVLKRQRSYLCATRIRCGRLPRGAQYLLGSAASDIAPDGAPERRCSSRTFRYGYLVTT